MENGLSLDEAQQAILNGAEFGSVYPALAIPGDAVALRAFFCYTDLPRFGKRHKAETSDSAIAQGYTGDPCPTCGAMKMKRDGKCLTCTACGSTAGGCS